MGRQTFNAIPSSLMESFMLLLPEKGSLRLMEELAARFGAFPRKENRRNADLFIGRTKSTRLGSYSTQARTFGPSILRMADPSRRSGIEDACGRDQLRLQGRSSEMSS